MKRLSYNLIALIGVVGLILGYLLTHFLITRGLSPLILTPLVGVVFLTIAVYLYLQGRRVLKLKRHQYTEMSYTGAFKVAVLSHSSAYTSAFFIGFMLAQLVFGIIRWEAVTIRAGAIASLFGLAGAIPLLIVAIIVERWCVIDDEDEDDKSTVSGKSVNLPRRATS
ncbi:DUF3180 family protein [Actinomycetaceae bacterium TAE3-ERU4]|nr:DUF3180 family protein [Actinomycetaceae bacterium TAE3-ERU4]